jgi:hypothetical protein
MERAFERLQNLNAVKFEQAETEAKAEVVGARVVGTNLGTVKRATARKSSEIVEFKKQGP